MSATADVTSLCTYFNNVPATATAPSGPQCSSLHITGTCYPVDIMYLRQPCRDYLKAAVDLVFLLHVTERRQEDGTGSRSTGDILLFLPTAECVDQCLRLIQDRQDELYDHMSQGVSSAAVDDSLIALPLYSALPASLQARVFLSAEELFLARAGHSVDAVRAGSQIEQTAKQARKLVVATAFAGKYSAIPLCYHCPAAGRSCGETCLWAQLTFILAF